MHEVNVYLPNKVLKNSQRCLSWFANSVHIKLALPYAAQLTLHFLYEKSAVMHMLKGPV